MSLGPKIKRKEELILEQRVLCRLLSEARKTQESAMLRAGESDGKIDGQYVPTEYTNELALQIGKILDRIVANDDQIQGLAGLKDPEFDEAYTDYEIAPEDELSEEEMKDIDEAVNGKSIPIEELGKELELEDETQPGDDV